MTQNDEEWPKRFARVVAGEVKRHRKLRKMSAQRLSDATAELGSPIPRTVLSNFENGRRPTISLAELLVIARALEVPPVLLLSPLGRTDKFEVLPGIRMDPWLALKWFAGEEEPPTIPEGPEEWHGVAPDRDGTRTVALFRDHERWSNRLVDARAQLWSAQQERAGFEKSGATADPNAQAGHELAVTLTQDLVVDNERSLRRVREEMRANDLVPPMLWPQLAYLEGDRHEQE
ncbi:helix-turn-helix domain-containing protein [Amycolatopsis pithecellobii]|uniref:helix-turn-helix domain-containing protein n=1 Tax=Amycolatopsis pithecellobii TaxID=664692 RepID=UPI00140847E8|nr:helix-turn-helix transcriptional regulator [Amycolatopsis pithecellobii]